MRTHVTMRRHADNSLMMLHTSEMRDVMVDLPMTEASQGRISWHRMDIAFATKEATRRMTSDTKDDCNRLVRLGRYLVRYQ